MEGRGAVKDPEVRGVGRVTKEPGGADWSTGRGGVTGLVEDRKAEADPSSRAEELDGFDRGGGEGGWVGPLAMN